MTWLVPIRTCVRQTIETQTNTFMPGETMMLLREDQGADGQLKLSGEYEKLLISYYILPGDSCFLISTRNFLLTNKGTLCLVDLTYISCGKNVTGIPAFEFQFNEMQ